MKEPIAIVGMACHYPGAPDLESFWRLLTEGRDGLSDYVPGRSPDLDAYYATVGSEGGPLNPRIGALDGFDRFDAGFFGISPAEAELMDPQQRWLLEVAWEALEDAGQPLEAVSGPRSGAFVGVWTSDYAQHVETSTGAADYRSAVCNALFGGSGRLAFAMNLRGPEISVNAGCASSLIAIHEAIGSLRSGQCDLALAGGANAIVRSEITRAFTKTGALAADGRCKFGDASADGFVRAEGAGVIVLKRLSDALAAWDRIYAIIRGSAVNSSGSSSGFLIRPSRAGQAELIEAALADAGLTGADIQYVDAHGTGTSTGDPIELSALSDVIGRAPGRPDPCLVGSVKGNIGHTEAAAGVASVIKAALAIRRGQIPAVLHIQTPTPAVDWSSNGLELAVRGRDWPASGRRAAVSSFGFTGANAQVILDRPPAETPESRTVRRDRRAWILPLAARSREALAALAERYADALDAGDDPATLIAAAATRRSALTERAAFVAADPAGLSARLRGAALRPGAKFLEGDAKPVFVFPGQGSQWAGMGRDLLRAEPAFRAALEVCEGAVRAETGWSVFDQLADDGRARAAGIERVQPTLFAMQVALARLWASWGVIPSVVVGHSMGEIAAAQFAGALSLEDAAKVVCRRSALMSRFTNQGAMALVDLSKEEAASALIGLEDSLSVAVSNGPRATVLAGEPAALASLVQELERSGVFCRPVAVQVAAHSPQMDPIRTELLDALQGIAPRAGTIPIFSTTRGERVDGSGFDAVYWADNLREPVLFHDAIAALVEGGARAFVEISPHPILLPSIEEIGRTACTEALALPSLRREEPEQEVMLNSLGGLYAAGARVDWRGVYGPTPMIDLPSYPWNRARYWIEGTRSGAGGPGAHPMLSQPFCTAAGTWVWTAKVDTEKLAWLKDHGVRGAILLPAAGFVEIAAAAAREVMGEQPFAVDELRLKEAVVVPVGGSRLLQVVMSADRPGRWGVQMHLADETGEGWTLAASAAAVETDAREPAAPDETCASAPPEGAVVGEEHSRRMASLGYGFGPAFRSLRWRHVRSGRLTAYAALPDEVRTSGYRLHPALLDAAFQAVAASLIEFRSEPIQLIPQAASQVRTFPAASGARSAFIEARLDPAEPLKATVTLFTEAGLPIAEAIALRFRAFPAGGKSDDRLLYELAWDTADLPAPGVQGPRRWLLLGGADPFASALADALRAAGVEVDRAPARMDGTLERWLETARASGRIGVVHLDALALAADAAIEDIAALGGRISALATLLDRVGHARLHLVTRRGRPNGPGAPRAGSQASVWGLGAVLANELPDLGCRLIDLGAEADPADAPRLAQELLSDGDERRVELAGTRRVARLRPRAGAPAEARPRLAAGERAEVIVGVPGLLDSFTVRTGPRSAPRPDEIEIEVHAAGLNFIDVLRAMGMMDPLDPGSSVGLECAGRIVRVGEEVNGFEPGDRVLAFAPGFSDAGAIASHLVTSAVLAAKIPVGLSFAEAASLPCAYVTSHFALVEAARMRPGERVLIHSATGGVGLSAIAVARRLGVDIVGSAGTPEKRDLLRQLGVAKVLDSRAPGVAATVAELTGGRGVDAILNSLVGSAIPDGLAALAPYGRFLEIGKRDMWDNSAIGMGALLRNRSIVGIDLATMVEDQPERVGRLLRDVVEAVDQGAYPALPITVFPADRVAEAFQMMAAARHTGKVAIDTTKLWEGAASESTAKRATYLVTGGFGALGLVAAEVLADRGARRLALVGRREPSGAAADQIDALRRRGIVVRTSRIDISDPVEVRGLLDAIAADGEELRGIVHSAGVLDDGVAAELTPARFETVMRGKVEGARILDELTAGLPIELFVVFSSAAAVLGNPGQGNYAAANAMLDALAEDRRARGLPALSIAWGPWAEVGLAAKESNRGERVAALGLQSLSLDEGRRLLAELIAGGTGDPWIAAMRFDAAQWVRTVAPGSATLLSPLLPAGDQDAADDAASIPGRIRDLEDVRGAVVHHLAALLRTAPESVAHDKPFQSLGLDSLMGIELRNRLERALDAKLSVSTIWNYSTVERLARHLADALAPPESESRPSGIAPPVRAETPDEALERELADAEALLVGSGRG